MKLYHLLLGTLLLLLLAGCTTSEVTQETQNEEIVYKLGFIGPLTGDSAVVGEGLLRAAELAVKEVNLAWEGTNKRLELIAEDGKCTGKDGLLAAQNLVQNHGVSVIFGGTCSGETLGLASFTEQEQILVFSSSSSSPEITTAGDFIFRNYPSDTAQVQAMIDFIEQQEYQTVAMISENTDFAQALREKYAALLPEIGVELVVDEVIAPEAKDVRTEMTKLIAATPDAALFVIQNPPTGGVLAKQSFESNLEADVLGNDVIGFDEVLEEFGSELEGAHYPSSFFEKEQDPVFIDMVTVADCGFGFYCASSFDAIFLLAEVMDVCNGDDTVCMRDRLYATSNWPGPFTGATTFDENGDVGGSFVIKQVQNGSGVTI